MVDTKLVMELEEVFKKEPMNLYNTLFRIKVSYGTIEINPDENYIQALEDANIELANENDRLKDKQRDMVDVDELQYYIDLLDDNDIEYKEY